MKKTNSCFNNIDVKTSAKIVKPFFNISTFTDHTLTTDDDEHFYINDVLNSAFLLLL